MSNVDRPNEMGPGYPVWLNAEGNAITCHEKLKLLNDAISDIEASYHMAVEDFTLLGASLNGLDQFLIDSVIGSRAEPKNK